MKKVIILLIGGILFCSCDILLPRPISDNDDDQEYYESTSTVLSDLTKDEAGAVTFLTDFYILYINWFMGETPSSGYEECLSKDLLKAFEYFDEYFDETGYQVLDCDPFIKAQDVASSLREWNFVIKKTDETNCYEMCYDDICVKLYVIKQNGKYLIEDVENETAGTVCRLMNNMLYSY